MKLDSHYYRTYALLLDVGYSRRQARTTAWANQFVDDCRADNYESFQIGQRTYHPIYTQDYSRWASPHVQQNIYVPFHFTPGLRLSRRGKGVNLFNVIERGRIVDDLLDLAIAEKDPYFLGVAIHAFQDSFSHQGFSGLHEDWNGGRGWPASLLPNIGHCEFGTTPDEIDETWERFGKEINNRQRFSDCFWQLWFKLGEDYENFPTRVLRHDVEDLIRAYKIEKYEIADDPEKLTPQEYKGSAFHKFQVAAFRFRQRVFEEIEKAGVYFA